MKPELYAHPRASLFRVIALRLWPIVLIGVLVGAVSGWLVGMTAKDEKTATAAVLLNPLDGNAFYPSSSGEELENLATEAQVLRSDKVARLVIEKTGADVAPQQMLENVTTTVPANTQIVEVTYASPSKDVAVTRAQSFADSFLQFRQERARDYVERQVKGIDEEIDNLRDQIRDLTAKRDTEGTSTVDQKLYNAQIDSSAAQVTQLIAQKSSLATTTTEPGQIITPANLDRGDLVGRGEILIALGVFTGALLSLVVIYVLSRGRGWVRASEEIEAHNVDPIARIPVPDGPSEYPYDLSVPPEQVSSEFLQFRAQFLALLRRNEQPTLLLTSSVYNSTPPLSLTPLAQSLAAAEVSTVVVDTTGRVTVPETYMKDQPGLSELLRDSVTLEKALIPVTPYLHLIGGGNLPDDCTELFLNPRLKELTESLSSIYDIVLIAGGSLQSTTTQSLASSIPHVLLDVEFGRTRHLDLRKAVTICRGLSAQLLGALIISRTRTSKRANTTKPEKGSSEVQTLDRSGSIPSDPSPMESRSYGA